MDEYLTELIPVAEWEWWLWRVTWRNDFGQIKQMWCVSTETHIESEVDYRWPSDYWKTCTWEAVQKATEPKQLWCPVRRCEYPEDAWTAGDRVAKVLNLCITAEYTNVEVT